ncbi:HD domain-containing protein 2-like, partial [Sinocyclocheilus grahami]
MDNMLQFMKLVGQLKRVPRTGWVYRNIKHPESVSDHMYRMSMMALTIKDITVSKERCMKLALVHDLAECIVGDIAPADNVSKAEKHRREKEAMVHITGLLDDGLRKEIYSLWEEYETQSSPEAKLVKELDQLEMILQAHEYEELERKPGRLQEFFTSTEGLITSTSSGSKYISNSKKRSTNQENHCYHGKSKMYQTCSTVAVHSH